MGSANLLNGVFAAMVTPLAADLTPDLEGVSHMIEFLAGHGCHGILIMGTTGEGPSFSSNERLMVLQQAVDTRTGIPDFKLLAGTGAPSLEETISLTRSAFDLGFEAAVVLPPYYYRNPMDEGLFSWFSKVLDQAVPSDGLLLGYHIPQVTGVSLSLELLERLKKAYPEKFAGIKDSSGDLEWARSLAKRFGADLTVLNGNDRLFSSALQLGASGCITAVANLLSPLHRTIWDSFQAGILDEITQDKLSGAREVLDRYPPMPPVLKMLLNRVHGFPNWKVKPPLLEFSDAIVEIVLSEFLAILE